MLEDIIYHLQKLFSGETVTEIIFYAFVIGVEWDERKEETYVLRI
jgi:hypothetical protein